MSSQSSSADMPAPDGRDDDRAEHVARLFREHNEALVRFLRVKLRSEQDARDVAQEAYVRLMKLDSTDGISFFQAYLFKVANNLAIDRLRRQSHVDAHRASVPDDAPEHAVSAEEAAATAEKIERLRRYLGELPPKCRKAFLLRKFHHRSVRDIALELGVSERTVGTYLRHALKYCRHRLDQDMARERTAS